MNQNLNKLRNWKTFAIVLGVAIVASLLTTTNVMAQTANSGTGTGSTTGQMPQIQGSVNLPNLIQSNIKEKFVDAANAAVSKVPNGNVISGRLGVIQGSLVYQFTIIDDKNMVYQVIVDAGNGNVLYTSQGHQMGKGGMFGIGGMGKMHGHGMMKFHGNGYTSQAPSQTTPSQTTPSSLE